jgi:hypothetical protein
MFGLSQTADPLKAGATFGSGPNATSRGGASLARHVWYRAEHRRTCRWNSGRQSSPYPKPVNQIDTTDRAQPQYSNEEVLQRLCDLSKPFAFLISCEARQDAIEAGKVARLPLVRAHG